MQPRFDKVLELDRNTLLVASSLSFSVSGQILLGLCQGVDEMPVRGGYHAALLAAMLRGAKETGTTSVSHPPG